MLTLHFCIINVTCHLVASFCRRWILAGAFAFQVIVSLLLPAVFPLINASYSPSSSLGLSSLTRSKLLLAFTANYSGDCSSVRAAFRNLSGEILQQLSTHAVWRLETVAFMMEM